MALRSSFSVSWTLFVQTDMFESFGFCIGMHRLRSKSQKPKACTRVFTTKKKPTTVLPVFQNTTMHKHQRPGQRKHSRVRAFRFLVFRFRLDSWWFGVPLLTRGVWCRQLFQGLFVLWLEIRDELFVFEKRRLNFGMSCVFVCFVCLLVGLGWLVGWLVVS